MSQSLMEHLPLRAAFQKKLLEIAQQSQPLALWGQPGTEKESFVSTWYEMKFGSELALQKITCHETFTSSSLPTLEENRVYYFHNLEMLPVPTQEFLAKQIQGNSEVLARLAVSSSVPLRELAEAGLFSKTLAAFFKTTLEVPALIGRGDEISDLVEHAQSWLNTHYHLKISGVSREALNFLNMKEWRGNTSQMLAAFEGACLRRKQGNVELQDFYV